MRVVTRMLIVSALITGSVTVWPQANPPSTAAGLAEGAPGQRESALQPDTRSDKQKALAKQAERLFDMATELKVQVDKTNKNILSLKVVEKAEQIEALAKGMKEQARK